MTMLIENVLVKDIASGKLAYISRVIGSNLFEVEFYDDKKPMKWFKNDEQGITWDFPNE